MLQVGQLSAVVNVVFAVEHQSFSSFVPEVNEAIEHFNRVVFMLWVSLLKALDVFLKAVVLHQNNSVSLSPEVLVLEKVAIQSQMLQGVLYKLLGHILTVVLNKANRSQLLHNGCIESIQKHIDNANGNVQLCLDLSLLEVAEKA